MHQKSLYYLNLNHEWLRHCKIVYRHYKNIFTFYLTTWGRHLAVIKLFLLCAFQREIREIKHLLFYASIIQLCLSKTSVMPHRNQIATFYVDWLFFLFVCFVIAFLSVPSEAYRVTKSWDQPSKPSKCSNRQRLACLLTRQTHSFGIHWSLFGNTNAEQNKPLHTWKHTLIYVKS